LFLFFLEIAELVTCFCLTFSHIGCQYYKRSRFRAIHLPSKRERTGQLLFAWPTGWMCSW